MGALRLIEEARSAGLKLRAEGDRLVIRGPKSAEPIAKALLDHKAEILPFLQEEPAAIVRPSPAPRPFHDNAREGAPATDASWHCRYCSQPLTIDEVCSSLDGERTLTLWRCDPCGVAGVTPDAIQKPPLVWVKTVTQ